jgi:hypothetical protein
MGLTSCFPPSTAPILFPIVGSFPPILPKSKADGDGWNAREDFSPFLEAHSLIVRALPPFSFGILRILLLPYQYLDGKYIKKIQATA